MALTQFTVIIITFAIMISDRGLELLFNNVSQLKPRLLLEAQSDMARRLISLTSDLENLPPAASTRLL